MINDEDTYIGGIEVFLKSITDRLKTYDSYRKDVDPQVKELHGAVGDLRVCVQFLLDYIKLKRQ